MRLRVFALFFSCLSVFPFAHAVGAEDCDKASSSADVMRCVNQNLEQAQDKLNIVYKTLGAKKPSKSLKKPKSFRIYGSNTAIRNVMRKLNRLKMRRCVALRD